MLGWQNNGLDSQSTTDTSAEPPIGVFFAYVAPHLQPDTTLFLPSQRVTHFRHILYWLRDGVACGKDK
ncbi:hypothetical protein Hdeb2414_s0001g00004941 [Helianthus debilis subsp. tardiflorus]